MSGGDRIRVCARFRPMNKVESSKPGNHICVKISACRRGVRVVSPGTADKDQLARQFYLDQIYPPGVSQEDVYKYTGKPLVDAAFEGINSCLFAYGQTGSGKTFSMMGVLDTDNRGIIPRVIEDVFDNIEKIPDSNTDEYSVSISMCEIYLERIRDLLNPAAVNLKVRDTPDGGVHVEGISETFCCNAVEALETLQMGFDTRATSATAMNSESSRSHCVMIIKVIAKKAGGSVRYAKIKLIDLAGSEKTKKTGAEGARLEEAQAINQSLSALNGCIKAIGEGQGFIPYRNSKLTRLLQDSLGGNSRTSLLAAVSPCSYNVEETVSTFRFASTAKKVKTRPKINEELSLSEYQKLVKKQEFKIKKLEKDVKLRDLQLEACQAWIDDHSGSYAGLISDIRVLEASDDDEAEPDVDFSKTIEVSDQAVVINKKTGKVEFGQAIKINIGDTPADVANSKRRQSQMLEDALIEAGLAAQNGYIGSKSSTELEDLVDDLRAELRGSNVQCEDLESSLSTTEDKLRHAEIAIKRQEMQLTEFKIYKQKSAFLEREYNIQMERLNMEMETLRMANSFDEDDDETWDIEEFIGSGNEGSDDARDKITKLAIRLRKQAKVIASLRESNKKLSGSCIADAELLDGLCGDDDAKKQCLQKLLGQFKNLKVDYIAKDAKVARLTKDLAVMEKRNKFVDQIRNNWKTQLHQFEQAVVLCSAIHARDCGNYKVQLDSKDVQIKQLKEYIQKMHDHRNKRQGKLYKTVTRIRGPRKSSHSPIRKKKVRRTSRTLPTDKVDKGQVKMDA